MARSASAAATWEPTVLPGLVGLRRLREGPEPTDRLTVGQLGPLRVVETIDGPGQAVRTRRDVLDDDPGRYAVFVQAEGRSTGEQDGRRAVFGPGEVGLVDLSRPMHCTLGRRRAVMVTFPKSLSPFRPSELAPLTGAACPPTGTAGLVSGLVRQLPRHLEAGAEGARLAAVVLDLILTGMAVQIDREGALSPQAHRRALLAECRGYIEENLDDPQLGPGTVAAARHVSVRHLHRLFEPTGTGVAGYIRRRRLDRCRSDLLASGATDAPVAAIGARWGLPDPAHFSRVFKQEYGLPPAEYRRRHVTEG